MVKKTGVNQSESEMCAGFMAIVSKAGWVPYSETAGFDLVLSKPLVQIGIQAKLRFNTKLLDQIIPGDYWHDDCGPPYRAVLVPELDNSARRVLKFLGIIPIAATVFKPVYGSRWTAARIGSTLDDLVSDYPRWSDKLLPLPDYVPDVPAGASGPVQLTNWKIGALRVCAILELRGHVTRDDFRRFHVDHRRWVPAEWLDIRDGVYVAGARLKFAQQHPVVYEQIKAEISEWLRKNETGVLFKELG